MRYVILLATAVVLFGLAACGDGDGDAGGPGTPTPTLTVTTAPTPSPTPAPQVIAAPPNTIVARFSDFNREIYTVAPDGGGLTRVTDTPGHVEYDPAWSLDGRLAFIRYPLFAGHQGEVVVTKPDGTDPVPVAGGMNIMYPAWSPGGDRIAFLVDAGSVVYQGPLRCPQSRIPRLFLADVAVATSRSLLELAAPGGCPIASEPRWSPDATRIALATRGVYVVDVASGRLDEIVPPTDAVAVAWSPDGQHLAVATAPNSTGILSGRVLVVGADGQGLTEIARLDDAAITTLAWSPQGDLIAFIAETGGASLQTQLYVVNPDGSSLRSLAQGVERGLAWSPDGRHLAVSLEDPSSGIYTVDVDDGSTTRLTDVLASDHGPAWSPDGSAIAFVSGRDAQSGIFAVHLDGELTPLIHAFDPEPPEAVVDSDGRIVVPTETFVETDEWDRGYPVSEPTLSPDGRRLAKSVPMGGMISEACGGDIHVWNVDGSQVTNLTDTPDINEIGLVWSPDSLHLALISGGPSQCHLDPSRLEVIKADGSERRLLADFGSSRGRVELPEWVSAGSALLFSVRYPEHEPQPGLPASEEKAEIYTVNIDGSGLRRLLEFPDARIEWLLSPDRTRLAVVEAQTAGGWRALVASVDGTGVQEVARGQLQLPLVGEWPVRWSPDSSRLAFPDCQGDPCQWALFVVNADGSDLRRLVESLSAWWGPPIWSPDGSRLAFVSHPEPCVPGEGLPPGHLEVVKVDGTEHQRLTERCIVREIVGWVP